MTAGSALAVRIEQEIVERRLGDGQLLGTERDLCARFTVTPTMLRQATRILEARDVVTTRRGVSGGVYVRKTSLDTVASYVATLWELDGVDLFDLAAQQAPFRSLTFEAASRRMSMDDADQLRHLQQACRAAPDSLARSQRAVQREDFIASLSANPLLVLNHAIVTRFIRNMIPFENLIPVRANVPNDTDQWVEALVAGEAQEAVRIAGAYTSGMLKLLETWRLAPKARDEGAFATSRPVWLARRIIEDIRTQGLHAGAFLGTEAALISRYGVARGTWRQALRLLEEHPAVTARRGAGGGVYVARPDRIRAEQMIAVWLDGQAVSFDHYAQVLAGLCLSHLDLLGQADDADWDRLNGFGDGGDIASVLKALASIVASRSVNPTLTMMLALFPNEAGRAGRPEVDSRVVDKLRTYCVARDHPAAARALRQLLRQWL